MENIQEYDISFDIGDENKLYRKISKLEKRLTRMQNKITSGAVRGGKYSHSGGGIIGEQMIERVAARNIARTVKRSSGGAKDTLFAKMLKQEQSLSDKQEMNRFQGKSPKQDSHVKAYESAKLGEEKLQQAIQRSVNSLKYRNKLLNEMDNKSLNKYKALLKEAKTLDDLRLKEKEILHTVRREEEARKKNTREMQKQNIVQQRLNASLKQMVGTLGSLYAGFETLGFVTRTGQSFEGINSAMLVVSGNAELAAENIQFIREESMRLGKPLQENAKAFSKMLAARGNLSQDQIKDVFSSMQEMATVLGLTADENNRGMVSISQMLAKGTVTAEELKQQLAEAGFANAIPEMVKAAQDVGMIDKNLGLVEANTAFIKLQEQGKVITEKILPRFAERMREAAAPGLAEKLESNAVAMGRLVNVAAPLAANELFQTGFGDGLTDLFNTLAKDLEDLIPLFKGIGRILGSMFHIISRGLDLITPPIRFFGLVLDQITEIFGKWSAVINTGLLVTLGLLFKKIPLISKFATVVRGVMMTMLLPIMKVVGALMVLEELLNALVFKDKVGYMYDPRLDPDSEFYEKSEVVKKQKAAKLTNPLMNSIVENDYLKGTSFNFENLKSFITNMIPQTNVNVEIKADRDGMAAYVTQTDTFKNSVVQTMYPVWAN